MKEQLSRSDTHSRSLQRYLEIGADPKLAAKGIILQSVDDDTNIFCSLDMTHRYYIRINSALVNIGQRLADPSLPLEDRRVLERERAVLLQENMDETICFSDLQFTPEKGEAAKIEILACLSWEGSLLELPEHIRARIGKVREALSQMSFSTFESFNKAYRYWSDFRNWMHTEYKDKEELRGTGGYLYQFDQILNIDEIAG